MNELTPEERVTKAIYDANAEKWGDSHNNPVFWKKEMGRFASLVPAGRVLEVGSGVGREAAGFIEHGYVYVGIDVSSGLLRVARQRNPRGKFMEMSLYDLHFDEPFDGLWCLSTLLHIPKRRIGEALESIRGCLKPGAVGLVTMKEGDGERVERLSDASTRLGGRFFAFWQMDELRAELEKHGLEVFDTYKREVSPDRPKLLCFWLRAR
jgi:SAM-dependent methyltransferase